MVLNSDRVNSIDVIYLQPGGKLKDEPNGP